MLARSGSSRVLKKGAEGVGQLDLARCLSQAELWNPARRRGRIPPDHEKSREKGEDVDRSQSGVAVGRPQSCCGQESEQDWDMEICIGPLEKMVEAGIRSEADDGWLDV